MTAKLGIVSNDPRIMTIDHHPPNDYLNLPNDPNGYPLVRNIAMEHIGEPQFFIGKPSNLIGHCFHRRSPEGKVNRKGVIVSNYSSQELTIVTFIIGIANQTLIHLLCTLVFSDNENG